MFLDGVTFRFEGVHPTLAKWIKERMIVERGMLDLGVRWEWVFDAEYLWWGEVPMRMTWCGEWVISGPPRRVKRGRPMLMDWQVNALLQIFPGRTVEAIVKFYSKHPEGPRTMALPTARTGVKKRVMEILGGQREW